MSTFQIAILMLALFAIFTVMRIPMGIGLGLSSIAGIMLLPTMGLSIMGQSAFGAMESFPLIAIPLYIFAGNAMSEGGIAAKLVDLASVFIAKISGGLAMIEVFACAFFAAISGSSTATTVAIGSMMTPELEKKGYDRHFALALAAAGGVMGPIIPPSVGMVLYGVATGASIAQLFIGGVLPGLMMMTLMLGAVYVISKRRGYRGDNNITFSIKKAAKAFWQAKWAIFAPVIILGGIYGGVFTPTEAGAVVCVYAIIVSVFIEKRLTIKKVWELCIDTSNMSSRILFLVGIATVFGRVMTMAQIPQVLTQAIIGLSQNRYIAMLLINLFLLFVGCIMDASASILILSPILLPVAMHFGYSPVHFGVIMVTNMTIGAITPPVGCCLFAASAMANEKVEKIAKAALPFLGVYIIVLLIEIYFEPIVMTLPRLFA